MGSQLEQSFGESLAAPERLVDFISKLASDTVEAPRELSEALVSRLKKIAEIHNGLVPLHGRLFAQWMHHAFPRECPYPHLAGTTAPQTPDEWMKNQGQASIAATEDEMMCHVSGPCSTAGDADGSSDLSLPWLETE